MPTVFTDNFNGGVSGTALNGRAGTGGSWSCAGALAADIAGLKLNASNQVRAATVTGCLGRIETGLADHYAKAVILVTTTAAAVAVRAVDQSNFIGLRVANATQVEIFKRIGGTETSFGKVTVGTIGPSPALELRIAGTSAFALLNGAAVASAGPIADAVFSGVTKVGLWGKGSAVDPLADDFEGGTLPVLAGANARSVGRDRNAALNTSAAAVLAAAPARSSGRDRNAGIATVLPLVPTRGRGVGRDRNAAVAPVMGLTPARGRSVGRAGASLIGASAMLIPSAGRAPGRATTGGLNTSATLARGFVTPVMSDTRAVTVARDPS